MSKLTPVITTRKTGKKSKRPNKSPSRLRYWSSKHLEFNKIKALMRNAGLTRQQAERYWKQVRGNRRTPYTTQTSSLTAAEQKDFYRRVVA